MLNWLEKRACGSEEENVRPSIWLRMLVILDDTMVQHLFVKETNQQHHSKGKSGEFAKFSKTWANPTIF